MVQEEESADCWLARWGGGRKVGVLVWWAASTGMKWGVVEEGGRMQEEEGMGSCIVWLGMAETTRVEACTCAAAEA